MKSKRFKQLKYNKNKENKFIIIFYLLIQLEFISLKPKSTFKKSGSQKFPLDEKLEIQTIK